MTEAAIENLIQLIRADIRSERPYLVGSASGRHCKLNQNECPYDLPPELKEDLLTRYGTIQFNRYPETQPFRLMSALEKHLNLPGGSILVGNGSNDLTQTLALCFVSTGTNVVLPRPMFALFESVVRMHSGEVVPIPPLDSLDFDMESVIRRASDSEVALTVVATPNNPTGLSIPFSTVEELCDQAAGFVVIDEAYHEFCPEPSALTLLNTHPNLIVMRTLSKAFGLAGIRIGYLVAHPYVIAELLKARLPFMVDRFSEEAAMALLDREDVIRERVDIIKRDKDLLSAEMEKLEHVAVVPSSTNFVIFKTPLEPKVLFDRLDQVGVVIRMMAPYPELAGYLRVTTGTEDENKAFIAALKNALSETT